MKKLFLAAFLLTAGLTTFETVIAAPSTHLSVFRAPKIPAAVLQAYQVNKDAAAQSGYILVNESWSSSKGIFTVHYDIYDSFWNYLGSGSSSYTRKGEPV